VGDGHEVALRLQVGVGGGGGRVDHRVGRHARRDQPLLDLLRRPSPCFLATLMPDGSPQMTQTWVDTDGRHVLVNTVDGHQKVRNMRRDPRVSMALIDPDNPYRYLQLQGRVVEITEEGADRHIDKMAKKYLGQDKYPFRQPGEVRVLYKIEPDRVSTIG